MKKALLLASLIIGFSAAAHAVDCAESKRWIVKLIKLRTPVGSAETIYFPSGRLAKLGDTWYYENGRLACLTGNIYYENGSMARIGDTIYFRNGRIAKIGDTWYYDTGRLACLAGTLYDPNGSIASTGAGKCPGIDEMAEFIGLE